MITAGTVRHDALPGSDCLFHPSRGARQIVSYADHATQVVRVGQKTMCGKGYLITAPDGWEGIATPAELIPVNRKPALDVLPDDPCDDWSGLARVGA